MNVKEILFTFSMKTTILQFVKVKHSHHSNYFSSVGLETMTTATACKTSSTGEVTKLKKEKQNKQG